MRHTLALLAAGLLAGGPLAHAQSVAITNAKVYTMTGPALERATVLIRDGKIAAVGEGIAIPAGVRVIDAAGKVVTPGFLDSFTHLGIVEIEAIGETADQSTNDDRITAAFNVADALNPFSTLIPITRVEGITRAVVAPQPGASLIAGQGVLIDLSGEPGEAMIHRNPVAMYAVLGAAGAEKAGGARAAALLRLREALQDARDYAAHRLAFEEARRREYALSRLDLEALVPVARRQLPLAVHADRAADILAAIRFARELGIELVLLGAAEGWLVADEIARARVPVVINPLQNLPGFDRLGATLENAARLHAAGVTVAFATFEAHNSRNLKQAAGNAVAYGMPYEEALRAITLYPARIWGVADRYGSIEPGKDGDIVVWSGDPLELTSRAEHVFIRGREVPMTNRQRELAERYRDLGTPLPPAYRP
jgi:imidazolonepropionase-like amidohydrolase